ncbi:MAG: hypothetical protein AAB881_01810 [Patescibacteria group bacterium]
MDSNQGTDPTTADQNNTAGANDTNLKDGEILPGLSYQDLLNKDLIELMGSTDMPEAQKNEQYEKMLATIKSRVLGQLVKKMTEDQFNRFQKALQEKNEAEVNTIIEETKIDVPKLYAEEAILYKLQMVSLMRQKDQNTKEE